MEDYNHWKNTQIEDLPGEYWLPVKGYEGTMASNLGRVKTLDRHVRTSTNSNAYRFVEAKVKNQVKGKDGYLRVDAFRGNKCKKETAHKMCCLAFHDNPLKKKTVQHKNNIKHCNEEWNLCWFTQSEQLKDAFDKGRKISLIQNYVRRGKNHYLHGKRGVQIHNSRPINQISLNGDLIKKWDSIMDAARFLGISGSNISACARGKLKTTHNFIWSYLD